MQLRADLILTLPSGNRLRLVRRVRATWVCVYLDGSRQRGEVEFSGVWLRRFGKTLQSAIVR